MSEQVEIEVRYDRSSQSQLAVQIPELSSGLATVKITSQQSLELANALILRCAQWCKSVDLIMDPVRDATHKAWKASIKAQDDFKEPVLKPMGLLKQAATKFIVDAQAEAARIQAEVDAKQRRENEAEAKRVAAEMKAMDYSRADIKETKEAIKAQPAPVVQPVAEVAAGQSVRTFYGVELQSLPMFIKWLLTDEGNAMLRVLNASVKLKEAIEYELKPEATRFKESYSIPGTVLSKKFSGAWRG